LLPLFVGSLLCGTLLASVGYFFVLFLWRWRVIRNWEQRKDARQGSKREGEREKERARESKRQSGG